MSTVSTAPSPTGHPATARAGTERRRLPRWMPLGIFAAALAVVAVLDLLVSLNIALYALYTVVLGTVALYVLSRVVEGGRHATDRLVTCLVYGAFGLAMVPLLSLLYQVVSRGIGRFDSTFFSYSLVGVVGEGGGAYHAIMGTLLITVLTALISVPIGLLTAIYLVEYGRGRLKRAITFLVDVMTGIPSIVAGLFAYALFAIFFGPGVRMGLAGAVALSVLMIPVVVRAAEEVLKLVPNELREASYALGIPKWRTIV
jgi:phosphate transport system permease protein